MKKEITLILMDLTPLSENALENWESNMACENCFFNVDSNYCNVQDVLDCGVYGAWVEKKLK